MTDQIENFQPSLEAKNVEIQQFIEQAGVKDTQIAALEDRIEII
jgi:hypothetical protein